MSLDRYRSAVVTGASRGIGAAIVRQLCTSGIDVYRRRPLGRGPDGAGRRDRLPAVRARHLAARRGDERPARPQRRHPGEQRLGRWRARAPPGRPRPTTIDALLEVNLKGMLNCLAATVPGMKARGLRPHRQPGLDGRGLDAARHAGLRHDQGRHPQSQPYAAARPARQRRAGERDRAGACRDRRASGLLARIREEGRRRFYEGFECLQPADIAEAVMFVLGAPQRMDVSYMEIVPTDQSYGGSQFHRRESLEPDAISPRSSILPRPTSGRFIIQLSPRRRRGAAAELRRGPPAHRRPGARPAEARPAARRGGGHRGRQQRRLPRPLHGDHGGGPGLGLRQPQAAARDRGAYHEGLGREARRRRRRARAAGAELVPTVRHGGARLAARSRPVRAGRHEARGSGDGALHLGLDRPAQGRAAHPRRLPLGDRRDARAAARHRGQEGDHRRAAVPHERPVQRQAGDAQRRHHRADDRLHGPRLHPRHRPPCAST